jgi:hypothetical protein
MFDHSVPEDEKPALENNPEANNEDRGFPPPDAPEWSSLANFYENSWFTRVWYWQELLMAKEAWLVIGEYVMNFDTVGMATELLLCKKYHANTAITSNVAKVFVLDNLTGGPLCPLIGLLGSSTRMSATDPRNLLYALLGFAKETQDLASSRELVPDYTKPVVRVYHNLAVFLLKRDSNALFDKLNILSMVQHRPVDDDQGCPS